MSGPWPVYFELSYLDMIRDLSILPQKIPIDDKEISKAHKLTAEHDVRFSLPVSS